MKYHNKKEQMTKYTIANRFELHFKWNKTFQCFDLFYFFFSITCWRWVTRILNIADIYIIHIIFVQYISNTTNWWSVCNFNFLIKEMKIIIILRNYSHWGSSVPSREFKENHLQYFHKLNKVFIVLRMDLIIILKLIILKCCFPHICFQ